VGLGFLGGFIRGLIVGGFALACVSLYFGNKAAPTPERTEVEVPAGSEFTLRREDTAVQRPKPLEQTTTASAPEVMQPSVETSLGDTSGLTDAPMIPETGLVDPSSPSTPEAGLAAPAAPERPRLPTITSALPSRPQTEAQSAAPTQPKIERGNADATRAPSLESGQIVVPSDPAAPQLRRGDQTNDTSLAQVQVDAIETEDPYGKAIDLYAHERVNDEGKPKLSIVLMTDELNAIDPNLVQALPIPVTFAIDPINPSADALLLSLRELEQEAVILADLPPQAVVQDVDIALSALVNLLPRTVGFIERQAGALQQSRDVMLHVPEVLNRTGHGLIVYEKGLNTLAKEAIKAGTPVATIYRDLDGADQNERTIRRFLDGAVFRATNSASEPIVVLARLRPETMSAILIWALQERAQNIAVVPVSQLMQSDTKN